MPMDIYCWALLMGPLSMSAGSSVLMEPLAQLGEWGPPAETGLMVQVFCLDPEHRKKVTAKTVISGLI